MITGHGTHGLLHLQVFGLVWEAPMVERGSRSLVIRTDVDRDEKIDVDVDPSCGSPTLMCAVFRLCVD